MFLEKLTVLGSKGIIRDIPFKLQGLNLIIDTTPATDDQTNSGNNVGKTTFVRSIDFCLGSSGKDIYHDRETKSDNEDVKKFLIESGVTFVLSILNKDGTKSELKRSFDSEQDLFIDGVQFDNVKEYNQKLNEIFFHVKSQDASNISFRSLIKKFVRSDPFSEGNIYKILHTTVKDSTYEALYLLLFGFPDRSIISKRLELIDSINKINKQVTSLKGRSTFPKLQSRLAQLQKTIEEQESYVKNIDLPQAYNELLNKLKDLKIKTATLSSQVGNLNTKISLSQKTKADLANSESKIDPGAIRQLYENAKLLLPTIQKPFEEVLAFHNKMVANKLKFVDQHIRKLESERNEYKNELETLLKEQSHVLRLLDNSGNFDDLLKIREELNLLYTEKGRIDSQLQTLKDLQQDLDRRTVELTGVNLDFKEYTEGLNRDITDVFNKHFTNFTKLTHNEQLYVYYDDETRRFEFDNLEGNAGDGYKKTEIIAFDLAFIAYFAELGLDYPRFVLHDKLEIIHKNQIQTIFEIADSVPGQFIVSVLKDRISFLNEDFIDGHKILELSQDSKFFRFE